VGRNKGNRHQEFINDIKSDTFTFIVPYLGEAVATQVTEQVSVQVTEQVGELIDRRAKSIVYCTQPRTLKELMEFLGMKHRPTFMKNVLNPLMEAGLLKRTIPDKPRSRFQKYVAVKKGET
jgi:ATP-dependent DNA helicase RecG